MGSDDQILIAPIVLPLVTGALLLLFDERRHLLKAMINVVSTLALMVVALVLLNFADAPASNGARRPASTCSATGPRRSASCWFSTGCRR